MMHKEAPIFDMIREISALANSGEVPLVTGLYIEESAFERLQRELKAIFPDTYVGTFLNLSGMEVLPGNRAAEKFVFFRPTVNEPIPPGSSRPRRRLRPERGRIRSVRRGLMRKLNTYELTIKLADGQTVTRHWLDPNRAEVERKAPPYYSRVFKQEAVIESIRCVKNKC